MPRPPSSRRRDMTRAVRRKKLRKARHDANRRAAVSGPAARWALVGALVASGSVGAGAASPREPGAPRPLRDDRHALFGAAIASRLYVADAVQATQSGDSTSTPRRFEILPGPLGTVLGAL